MITTSIVFDHRGRVKRGELGPLEVRVTVNRKPYYINTGVRVTRAEWKYDSIVNRPDCNELNERLGIILRKIEREINNCMENDKPIDVAQIRKNVLDIDGGMSSNSEVVDWIKERIPMMADATDGTKCNYNKMLKRLIEFDMMKRWSDVNTDIIYRWNAWLHQLRKPLTKAQKMMGMEAEPLSDGTIYNYHKNLKHILYLAERTNKIARNPYDLLKGEFKKGEKECVEYLSEEEIQIIRNLRLQRGSHLDMVRDLFVMQIFTGMAYRDLMEFDIKNYKNVNGKWITNEERVKSGVAYIAHLLPPVVEILEKYGMKVPYITNQEYNRSLKKIGQMSGIEMRLRTHLARHTFGTYMLTNKVDIVNLQKMMGHKKIEQTLKYAKTIALSVHGDFEMIAEKMKKEKG